MKVYSLRDTKTEQFSRGGEHKQWTIRKNLRKMWRKIGNLHSYITHSLGYKEELKNKFPNTEIVVYKLVEIDTIPIEEFYFKGNVA